jgi:hypothetical protein
MSEPTWKHEDIAFRRVRSLGFLSKLRDGRSSTKRFFALLEYYLSPVMRVQPYFTRCSPHTGLVLGDAKLAFAKNSNLETTVALRDNWSLLFGVRRIFWAIRWRVLLTRSGCSVRKLGFHTSSCKQTRVRHPGIFLESGLVFCKRLRDYPSLDTLSSIVTISLQINNINGQK